MINSFRRSYQVYRPPAGAYLAGVWTVPAAGGQTFTILATVQPAITTDYDRLSAEWEGRRFTRMIRFYTSTQLIVADPRNPPGQADYLLYAPVLGQPQLRYQLVGEDVWQGGMTVDHYKYLAVADPEP